MKVVHSLGNKSIDKDADSCSFLLTNKAGNYLLLSSYPKSRYNGFFLYASKNNNKTGFQITNPVSVQSNNVDANFEDNKMFRFIENISLAYKNNEVDELTNKFNLVQRKKSDIVESFFLSENSLIYNLNESAEIDIFLDAKESYDSREFGRHYNIFKEKNKIIVEFIKKTDSREDDSHDIEEYRLYMVIQSDANDFVKVDSWVHRAYEDDKKRNSLPYERYVYHALRLKLSKAVFSFSFDRKTAVKEASRLWKIKNKKIQPRKLLSKNQDSEDSEIYFAYNCAINSLYRLLVKEKALFAGLPWFFQNWSRDEAVSSKALNILGKHSVSKRLLLRWLSDISPDGLISNRQDGSGFASADSVGWIIRRLGNMFKNKVQFTKKEKIFVVDRLEHIVYLLRKYRMKDNLIFNQDYETWMDSDFEGDSRSGFRIEIQALMLCSFRVLWEITGDSEYLKLEKKMRRTVLKNFWNGSYLFDGKDDATIRPNVFIAAYVYPELLSKKEWTHCFEKILPKLWLKWGGLSTIDKKNPLFCPDSTGEWNKSYHRGDSWFWVNNLVALVLHKTDKKHFEKFINKILKASTKEILWQGCIGHHAELSSASNLSSEGSLIQAWSAAMYVELVNNIHG